MAKVTGQRIRPRGATLASHGKPANYARQSAWRPVRTTRKSGPKA